MVTLLLLILVVVLALAEGPPIVRGWHLGYNGATDNSCETRLGLQWCGHLSSTADGASQSGAEQAGAAAQAVEKAVE